MSWLQFGLFFSIIIALYNFQQIKMTLKERGHDVSMFTGWISDYRKFTAMIKAEEDQQLKAKYQGILNALQLALVGLVVIIFLMLRGN